MGEFHITQRYAVAVLLCYLCPETTSKYSCRNVGFQNISLNRKWLLCAHKMFFLRPNCPMDKLLVIYNRFQVNEGISTYVDSTAWKQVVLWTANHFTRGRAPSQTSLNSELQHLTYSIGQSFPLVNLSPLFPVIHTSFDRKGHLSGHISVHRSHGHLHNEHLSTQRDHVTGKLDLHDRSDMTQTHPVFFITIESHHQC